MLKIAKIIPFKTKQQLEKGKALKVMEDWKTYLQWEEANRQYVEKSEAESGRGLTHDEVEWLNEWVKKMNNIEVD
ncbi:hypothetical protein AB1K83_07405 [Sporosarcina sp. 179-K 3D1 HS]|uniref:hypothetical protein n=1 Tax=Sporosarcina sp. 179-K 3D1 HS TaxID=3232169 RepID=UPI0039A0AB3D